MLFGRSEDIDQPVIARTMGVAEARGVPPAQVAMAWLLSKPAVTSPVFGATKDRQMDDAVAAVSLKPSPEEIARLEELYQPHAATEGYS